MNFTADIYKEALIMFGDLVLEIANKVLNQLGITESICRCSGQCKIESRQNYSNGDLLSYVQSKIPKLTLKKKYIYD